MPFPRRKPTRIALDLFDCIDERNGMASKWDLIKVVGTESQFHYWIEEFLLRDKFVEEQRKSNRYFYKKTEAGELLHKLLKNGKILQALLRVSGARARARQPRLQPPPSRQRHS
jgi:predicted transcriptional regulator